MDDYQTDDFFALASSGKDPAELWLQWEPAIDDSPLLNRIAWREGDDLLIKVHSPQQRPPRRLPRLSAQAWEGFEEGFDLVLASISGVVGRQRLRLSPAPGEVQPSLPGMGSD